MFTITHQLVNIKCNNELNFWSTFQIQKVTEKIYVEVYFHFNYQISFGSIVV